MQLAFITIHTFVLFSPTATVITSTKSSVFPCNIEFSSGAAKSLKRWRFVARYKWPFR